MKTFKCEIEAKRYMKMKNSTLTKKVFHKYFKVMIDGPEDNFAVVDFKIAYDMGVSYQVTF